MDEKIESGAIAGSASAPSLEKQTMHARAESEAVGLNP